MFGYIVGALIMLLGVLVGLSAAGKTEEDKS